MRWYASLRRTGEIAFVRRSGRHAGAAALAVYAASSRTAPSRVAVSVSKSVGKAVVRNRVKRRIRGALDAIPPPAKGLRLVVVARPAAARLRYAVLAAELRTILARAVPE